MTRALPTATFALALALASCSDDADSSPSSIATGGSTTPGAGTAANAGVPSGGTSATNAGTAGTAGNSAGAAAGGAGAAGASALDAGTAAGDAGNTRDAGATRADAGHDAAVNAASICPAGATYGAPLPANATATLVMGGFDFLEGPVWHAQLGVLFFSDMHMGGTPDANGALASSIERFTPPSSFDVFVPSSGSNGMALDLEGKILACTHDVQSLSTFDASSGARTSMTLDYMGSSFNSPNDVTVRSDGNIYFTDPDWQLPPRSPEIGFTGVYRLTPAGQIELVDDSLDKPNGIALSPDEKTLYVGSAGNDIMRYSVADDGSVGSGSVFVSPGGSDGMAVDCAGNLYVTTGSVRVFAPDGSDLGSISVAEQPANAAFGGPDHKTLYITARTGLYSIELEVPGYPY